MFFFSYLFISDSLLLAVFGVNGNYDVRTSASSPVGCENGRRWHRVDRCER